MRSVTLTLVVLACSRVALGQTPAPLKVYLSADMVYTAEDMLDASRFFNAIGFLSPD